MTQKKADQVFQEILKKSFSEAPNFVKGLGEL